MGKVAIFQEFIPLYRRGFFQRLKREIHHEVSLFVHSSTLTCQNQGLSDDLTPISLKGQLRMRLPLTSSYLKLEVSSLRVLWAGQYDLLILPNDILALHVWIFCGVARRLGRRICLWGHGFSRPDTQFRIALRRILMKMADAVIFYDQQTRQKWIDRGFRRKKLFVANNALDTVEIESIKAKLTAEDIQGFRAGQNLGAKKVIILCGGLFARKRPDLLIQAMPLILGRIPEAHALVVGDGPLMMQLKELTVRLHLENSITFCGGVRSEATLARLFLSSLLAVIPAAAGLGVQHAFGYGIPVVVGDDRATHGPEISLVKAGETGVFCRANDSDSLASAVVKLLENDALRYCLGRNAQRLIAEQNNLDAMVSGFLEAVEFCFRASR